jgi:hypothetical protein
MDKIWGAAQCGFKDWQTIWGDPWLSGTILVLSYAITGFLILRMARRLAGRERWLWMLCGAAFLFQAANTPLDLHAFIWTFGKCLAHAQGWYKMRHQVQAGAAIGVVVVAIVLLVVTTNAFRGKIWRNLQLLLGVGIALAFTVIKGISFHDLAAIYGRTLGPFHIADWVELFGIALALSAALMRLRASQVPRA